MPAMDSVDSSSFENPIDPAAPFRLDAPLKNQQFTFIDGQLPDNSQWTHAIDVFRSGKLIPSRHRCSGFAFDLQRGAGGLESVCLAILSPQTGDRYSDVDAEVLVDTAITLAARAAQRFSVPKQILRLMTLDPQIAAACAFRDDLWLDMDTTQDTMADRQRSLRRFLGDVVERLEREDSDSDHANAIVSMASTFLGAELSSKLGLATGIDREDLIGVLKDSQQRLAQSHHDSWARRPQQGWIFHNVTPETLRRLHRDWAIEHLESTRADIDEIRDTARQLLRDVFGE
jgi:hypothetical protein